MSLNKILNSRFYIVFLFPFILGLLTVFSFQPFNFIIVNFFVLPALFLILTHVNKKSKNIYRKKPYLINLFFVGYLFGIGYFISGTHWITYSLTFDESFKHLIPISLIGIPMFLGLFFGITTLCVGRLMKNNFTSILIFCLSLSIADFIRSNILSGFPWNLWAYSCSWFPETLQILKYFGLYGFNLLALTIFSSPLLVIFYKKKFNILFLFIFICLFFLNYIYGSTVINKNLRDFDKFVFNDSNSINVKLISPNIDLNYNLTIDGAKQTLKKLIKYSDPEKDKSTVFIWPEGVFTGYSFDEISQFKNMIKTSFSKKHIIIFGINKSKNNSENFNSLLAINNDFEILYQYNKKKLVPFGEFLPAEKFFNKFGLKKITQGYTSFAKGQNQDNLIINNLNILPLICYEIIFPELIRNHNPDTNLIVNISEDAWFGGSIGPQQHFAKAIFRSIESNTYLVRAANQGISAFIDNKGIVIKSLESHEKGHIELNVPLLKNNFRNKNDLIFLLLLFTYTLIFFTLRNKL
jgi:apolipoprotein N-acyltransferase